MTDADHAILTIVNAEWIAYRQPVSEAIGLPDSALPPCPFEAIDLGHSWRLRMEVYGGGLEIVRAGRWARHILPGRWKTDFTAPPLAPTVRLDLFVRARALIAFRFARWRAALERRRETKDGYRWLRRIAMAERLGGQDEDDA